MAILIQPRDLRAMVRGWTPGMTPRNHSLPRQKKFRHDNTDPSRSKELLLPVCTTGIIIFMDLYGSLWINVSIDNGKDVKQKALEVRGLTIEKCSCTSFQNCD